MSSLEISEEEDRKYSVVLRAKEIIKEVKRPIFIRLEECVEGVRERKLKEREGELIEMAGKYLHCEVCIRFGINKPSKIMTLEDIIMDKDNALWAINVTFHSFGKEGV
jgi:hypothetical protein